MPKKSKLAEESDKNPAKLKPVRKASGKVVYLRRTPTELSDRILGKELIVDKLALRNVPILFDSSNELGLDMKFVDGIRQRRSAKLPNGAKIHLGKLRIGRDDSEHPDLVAVEVRIEFNPSRVVFLNRLDGDIYVDQLPAALDALTRFLESCGVVVDFQDLRVRVQRIDFARDFLLGDTPATAVIESQFYDIDRPRAPKGHMYRKQRLGEPVEGFQLSSTNYRAKVYDLKRRHGPEVASDLRFEFSITKSRYGRYWDFRDLDKVTPSEAGRVVEHHFDRLRFGARTEYGYLDLHKGKLLPIPSLALV